jgi:hypothetical protein
MGYTTKFKGELKFVHEPTVAQLKKLNSMFGEDCREHPEWDAKDLSYIDLKLADDLSGIKWDDGTEKTYHMERLVNVVITEMRKQFPDFALAGKLLAQGEEIEDRWELAIWTDGLAYKRDLPMPGKKVKCPHCRESFYIEE